MPHFRDVGDRLKTRFDSAVKVIISNKGDKLIKEGETIKPPTELDLVYTTDSPDFCKVDSYYGTHGTVGRQCNDTYRGVGGCNLLCCNRGARMKKVVMTENCQCRFLWCCTVKCKKCRREQEVYTCEWLFGTWHAVQCRTRNGMHRGYLHGFNYVHLQDKTRTALYDKWYPREKD